MTTLPDVLKTLTTAVATLLDQTIQMLLATVENTFNAMVDLISTVQVTMPIGTVMSGAQVIDELRANAKAVLAQVVDAVKELESLDMILVKLAELEKVIVMKAQEFVDTLKSDILDAVAIYINAVYGNVVSIVKNVLDFVGAQVNMEQVNGIIDYIMDAVAIYINA